MKRGSALEFRRFADLTPADVTFDFHMHTTRTDGQNSPAEMISQAGEIGLTAIAFSEHVNGSSAWFSEFRAEVDELRRVALIDVYVGIEAKPLDTAGTMDVSPEVRDSAELVVGSVHRYPNGSGGLIPLADIPQLGRERAEEIELELALGMVNAENGTPDVLGHPMGVFSKFFDGFPARSMEKLMLACRENGVAFEVSTKYCSDFAQMVSLLRATNPTVSIGSDAHAAQDIGRSFHVLREAIASTS